MGNDTKQPHAVLVAERRYQPVERSPRLRWGLHGHGEAHDACRMGSLYNGRCSAMLCCHFLQVCCPCAIDWRHKVKRWSRTCARGQPQPGNEGQRRAQHSEHRTPTTSPQRALPRKAGLNEPLAPRALRPPFSIVAMLTKGGQIEVNRTQTLVNERDA
jgi:hypothetical protein